MYEIAFGPLILITAIAPIPGEVAGAIMVSFLLRFLRSTFTEFETQNYDYFSG